MGYWVGYVSGFLMGMGVATFVCAHMLHKQQKLERKLRGIRKSTWDPFDEPATISEEQGKYVRERVWAKAGPHVTGLVSASDDGVMPVTMEQIHFVCMVNQAIMECEHGNQ